MCLAIPARVAAVDGTMAKIELNGVERDVSIRLTPGIRIGEYVLVHAGYAIATVDEQEARKTLQLVQSLLNGSPYESP